MPQRGDAGLRSLSPHRAPSGPALSSRGPGGVARSGPWGCAGDREDRRASGTELTGSSSGHRPHVLPAARTSGKGHRAGTREHTPGLSPPRGPTLRCDRDERELPDTLPIPEHTQYARTREDQVRAGRRAGWRGRGRAPPASTKDRLCLVQTITARLSLSFSCSWFFSRRRAGLTKPAVDEVWPAGRESGSAQTVAGGTVAPQEQQPPGRLTEPCRAPSQQPFRGAPRCSRGPLTAGPTADARPAGAESGTPASGRQAPGRPGSGRLGETRRSRLLRPPWAPRWASGPEPLCCQARGPRPRWPTFNGLHAP